MREAHLFGGLAVVEPEVVAGAQVDGDGGVGEVLQVDGQHLLGHVVVVQLVVAHGHVHVQRQVLPGGRAYTAQQPRVWRLRMT